MGSRKRGGRAGAYSSFPDLPAWPLMQMLTRRVDPDGTDERTFREIYGTSQKTLREWVTLRRTHVEFLTADRVLCANDWHYWDIWTEETTRVWALEVRVYRPPGKVKLEKRAKKPRGREIVRAYLYGDLGPDFEALDDVEYAFTGERTRMAVAA
jgi:hypothetical protein